MNVTKDTREVEVEVITTKTEDVIVVELNLEETAALIALLGRVGGFTYTKPNLRTVVAAGLWDELQTASGISYTSEISKKYYDTITQSLRISDE